MTSIKGHVPFSLNNGALNEWDAKPMIPKTRREPANYNRFQSPFAFLPFLSLSLSFFKARSVHTAIVLDASKLG